MSDTSGIRLLAVDADDLQVISAACQDGLCKPADLSYDGKKRRFVIELNRFRWEKSGSEKRSQRIRTALAFEDVTSVKARGLPSKSADLVMSVMSVEWRPDDEPPGGEYRIIFAGDGELVISAECLDAKLIDVSQSWPTKNVPAHKE